MGALSERGSALKNASLSLAAILLVGAGVVYVVMRSDAGNATGPAADVEPGPAQKGMSRATGIARHRCTREHDHGGSRAG